MTRFALMVQRETGAEHETTHDVINDGHDALIALGHTPADAREKIEQALRSQGKFKSVDELIQAIYRNERKSS
jgi:Holliday junction DNA helicase RuvA